MSDNITRIQQELEAMGYQTTLHGSPQGEVVAFYYKVEVGSHKGKEFMVGISMNGGGHYPEYPPHWIHLSPPVDDGKGGTIQRYPDSTGRKWIVMSRPPEQLWDQLPTKSMNAYLTDHLRRIWNNM